MQLSLELWQTGNLRQEQYIVYIRKPNMFANFVVVHETNSFFAWQHRSRNCFLRSRSSNGRDPGKSVWDTVIGVLESLPLGDPQQCLKQRKPKKHVGHSGSFGFFDFVTPNAHISSM